VSRRNLDSARDCIINAQALIDSAPIGSPEERGRRDGKVWVLLNQAKYDLIAHGVDLERDDGPR